MEFRTADTGTGEICIDFAISPILATLRTTEKCANRPVSRAVPKISRAISMTWDWVAEREGFEPSIRF
ncbi:hypothetical protein LPN01_16460 [Sphingomonas sp. A2-49]|uniref:hypothetical protein n=1 Tax=Sphingomonas sp. A2-49 TaxID=1391375 RepID=UPI0021CF2D61|nr:hypothetical protein [Sphingomonas sp. A2-49]MCU6455674.1 hypothetical protein [Sphingomonas sp. A2-49]